MIKAYTDGACRKGNPGVCSCAWLVVMPGKSVSQAFFLGPELHTNNYAEYMGILKLLEFLSEECYTDLTIYCDSKLVVEQVNQRWNVTSNELRPLMSKAYGLLTKGNHTLLHIKGHSGAKGNEYVDELCNEILDEKGY